MIDILLASYNGEKYISEQIDSIINQTYRDWFLYIKDDCSTDNTIDIILEYEKKYKDKIKVILSDKPSGSAKDNFFSMLQHSKGNYIMTCDQDDIWLPDKIKVTFNKMKETESKNINSPILVHSDLKVADEKLNLISDSLLKLLNLDSNRNKINNLLVQNIVTGCTVMVNRCLLNYIENPPKHAVMHDWWMALIASSLGTIVFIETPTIMYRQHGNNSVGAKDVKSVKYIFSMLNKINIIKKSLNETYLQAKELITTIGGYIDENNYEIVNQYSLMYSSNKLQKLRIIFRYSLFKKGIIKIIGQILFC